MKKLLIPVILFSLALAACGGGGGVTPPTPKPSPSNSPISFSASIRFQSVMSGRTSQIQPQGFLRPMVGATNPPIMLVSVADSHGCYGYNCVGTSQQGVVQVSVSPIPSANPAVSFSDTDPHSYVQPTVTPVSPAPTPTGIVAENGSGTDGTANIQTSGQVSASIGSPVNTISTTNLYQYIGIGIDCLPYTIFGQPSGGSWPGWRYDTTSNSWVQSVDPGTSDIYCTGSNSAIPTNFQVVGDSGTLHVPGGCTQYSTASSYADILASSWVNSWTSIAFASLITSHPDGSNNAGLICKTADGSNTFKGFPNSVGSGGGFGSYDGAVEVSTHGVDGF